MERGHFLSELEHSQLCFTIFCVAVAFLGWSFRTLSHIKCLFFDFFAVWYDVVTAQDPAFALLDDFVSFEVVPHDIFWIASSSLVFLSVSVFSSDIARHVSTRKVRSQLFKVF